MNRLLSNIWLLGSVTVTTVVCSVLAGYLTGKWHWFARSGAIITMAGVILSVRPLIRMGFSGWKKSLSTIDYGQIQPSTSEIEENEQKELDARAWNIGVYMALVGTLISAYGDLVGGIP